MFGVPMKACPQVSMAENVGFSLKLAPFDQRKWPNPRLLHQDNIKRGLPKSRGCVNSYRTTKVVYYRGSDRFKDTLVTLVMVFSRGFEGDDGRLIAIPTRGVMQ